MPRFTRLAAASHTAFRSAREGVLSWWSARGEGVLLAGGLALTAVLSFQGGYLQGLSRQPEPLVIEKPALAAAPSVPTQTATATTSPPLPGDCALVGSRNSNKYHVPTSRCASQIKPANRVCFKDAEEAEKRGYVKGCLE